MLKNNLAALAKKNKPLVEIILQATMTGRYKLLPSQRADKLLNMLDLKTKLYYYNQYDPLIAVKLELDKRAILLPNVAIFLGFGCGYHITEYLKKCPYAKILVIESDVELLKTVFSSMNHTQLLNYNGFNIISGLTPVQMYPHIFNFFNQSFLLPYLSSINMIDNVISISGAKDFYIGAVRMLKEAISNILALYGNDPHDSLIGIQMTLKNLSTIVNYPGIDSIKDKFKGKPGIVVSTGPSLNKNIELLRGLENKAVIAAPDATVKVLKSHNIKPAHLVTSLERVIETAKLFEGLDEEDVKDSYLAACPVIVPETYSNFPGEKIIVYRNFATFKWIDIPKGILDIGPSAGNMAFKVLEWLGCDPIILIGQDLSFTDDEKTHATGATYGEKVDSYLATANIKIPGNYQAEVKTSTTFLQFLRHYERDLLTYKGTVINATEGGAKIEGAELMTFQEAIDKYIGEDIHPLEEIRKHLNYPNEKLKKRQAKELLQKMHTANNFSTSLITKLRDSVALCLNYEELLKNDPNLEDESNLKQSVELVKRIEDTQKVFNAPEFYLILMHYVQSYYIKAAMDITSYKFKIKPSNELNKLLVTKFKEFYSVIAALTDKINIDFINAISDIEKFIEQLNKNKD